MSLVQIYESYKKLLFSLYIDLDIKVRLGELVGYTFVKNSVKNLKATKDGLEN